MNTPIFNMREYVLQRAVAASAQAERLRHAAVALRRLAGALKYHPMTGQTPRPTPELTGALDAMGQVLNELQRGAAERADEEVLFTSRGEAAARQVRQAHLGVDQGAQVTAAAIEVLRRVLTDRDGSTLDAPYGHGAPSRHHPGALCTIVAERAEGLGRALESLAITKANLAAWRRCGVWKRRSSGAGNAPG